VPASLGQKITGHLDPAVYEQYNQKHQSDLRSVAQKRAEYLSQAVRYFASHASDATV
jgi:hypothetical protein